MATLEEILQSRDRRSARQSEILLRLAGDVRRGERHASLIVATIAIPGSDKQSPAARIAADAMENALRHTFSESLLSFCREEYASGSEIWLTVSLPPLAAKEKCTGIEDTHPLGRLFDIDVIVDGPLPLSRTATGKEPRKCLLCDRPARLCMRAGTHSYDHLINHIDRITKAYADSL